MKIVHFEHRGQRGQGIVEGDMVRAHALWPADAPGAGFTLPATASAHTAQGPLPLAQVQLLPPVTAGARIFCVGVNYQDHAAEVGRQVPGQPSVFLRTLESLRGHLQPLAYPAVSPQFDFEGEIAVVVGQPGRDIARAQALQHVFGYSCFMDGSVRDYQKQSLAVGKNFAESGAMGPWIVTADEVPDPRALTLTTLVNGQQMQHASARQLIYDIPAIMAYISTWTPLKRGDVIATGTPAGVGLSRTPPVWLQPGDRVDVCVDGIGTLSNPVERRAS
ncbi:fumarylacetoacetate hydrolase family protein [Pseudorhodoferax sp. Leaf265]|uniref:fumarylacetoacetate hydrolase family protein n=1 Tax=Pseudorhodoferax sp. Leaf265 TaxID=1736315 RepID=UPI0006FF4DF1|nr:fumarylacetoacetate hydrolase family protein [Pseudorhodoferax sp. Leaf265]KQP06161.1 hypothetical protein ASF45_08730 [Pseudorhodoferax sp. Leaf265]